MGKKFNSNYLTSSTNYGSLLLNLILPFASFISYNRVGLAITQQLFEFESKHCSNSINN